MRKFMATAALATVFLGAAACTTTTTAATPSSSPAPTVSLADIKTSCDSYAVTQVKYLGLVSAITTDMGELPGTDKAEVEAFLRKLVAKLQPLVADLKKAMQLAAAQAGDPAIKAELVKATDDIAKLEEQLAKATTMEDIMSAEFVSPSKAESNADKKIKELCRQAGAPVEDTMVKLMTK